MQKAKFVGNGEDVQTKEMGIKEGHKYMVDIRRLGVFERFIRGVELLVLIRVHGMTHQVPYSSRKTFLANWKTYKKGGAV